MNKKDITSVCGSSDDLNSWIYQLNDTKVYVREAVIDSVNRDCCKETNIIQITDVHLNYTNDEDKNNEEVMGTKKCRVWNVNAASVKSLKNAINYAKEYDQTIITGDILDYLSCGALELMDEHIWNPYPDVLACVGGHDLTRQMQTGIKDKTSLEERLSVLEKRWKNDIYYTSKIINDNVLVVVMNNACHKYFDSQIEKFENDIKLAREKKYTVLVFQHEPISTNRKEDEHLKSFYVWYDCPPEQDFYSSCIGCKENDEDYATKKMYSLILENADVIRGVFCGHYHSSYYMELDGTYKDSEGNIHNRKIPQYLLECNVYCNHEGHVYKITVK